MSIFHTKCDILLHDRASLLNVIFDVEYDSARQMLIKAMKDINHAT